MIPRAVRLRPGRLPSTRRSPRSPTAGDDAKVITGGQSLLPLLRIRLAAPNVLVDCGRIDEMRGVSDDGDALRHRRGDHPPRRHARPAGAGACARCWPSTTATVADPAIRHRGTFGGSLAHADPAGDLPAVALALDCTMVVAGPGGRREVAAADFFVDYFTTALAWDEVLVAVRVPKLGAGWGYDYQKFHRTAQSWAIVGVAAAVRRDERLDRRGQGGADEHGRRRRCGRRRWRRRWPGAAASVDAVGAACAGRRRRHPPDQRTARPGRLPRAPGPGAHPAGGDRGGRHRIAQPAIARARTRGMPAMPPAHHAAPPTTAARPPCGAPTCRLNLVQGQRVWFHCAGCSRPSEREDLASERAFASSS